MFIDRIHVLVQAGNGGNGCESYFRRTDKKVVPNGGDGGTGGSVIFRADNNAPPLANFRFKQHLLAQHGGHGGANQKRGKNGENLVVLVPKGTRIVERERQLLIRELGQEGDEVVVCQGGAGGRGNSGNRQSSRGESGKILDVELTITLEADLFLVGLPNSGKSTFLNTLTRAHAKEDEYPFTTRNLEIGVWKYSDYESVTICDMPSVYVGSHEGRGMGLDFLKHLEKARRILLFLDPVSQFASSLAEGLKTVLAQLEHLDPKYLQIPSAAVVNKMDLPEAVQRVKSEKFKCKMPVFYISLKTGQGLDKLKEHLIQCVKI